MVVIYSARCRNNNTHTHTHQWNLSITYVSIDQFYYGAIFDIGRGDPVCITFPLFVSRSAVLFQFRVEVFFLSVFDNKTHSAGTDVYIKLTLQECSYFDTYSKK